ncbi:hypothetical protein HZH68_011084 [Vespula germanica]|uniref:Uncharacterized protein n=1 Tax=Vespula germanica TaxID=30212 RepID=A0A834JQ18_VESGE|nr:hypothetical protein HZH68_011084 [Vespula germanica]
MEKWKGEGIEEWRGGGEVEEEEEGGRVPHGVPGVAAIPSPPAVVHARERTSCSTTRGDEEHDVNNDNDNDDDVDDDDDDDDDNATTTFPRGVKRIENVEGYETMNIYTEQLPRTV